MGILAPPRQSYDVRIFILPASVQMSTDVLYHPKTNLSIKKLEFLEYNFWQRKILFILIFFHGYDILFRNKIKCKKHYNHGRGVIFEKSFGN